MLVFFRKTDGDPTLHMKKISFQSFILVALISACAALGGCSPLALLNVAAPAKGISRQADIAYGPLSRHKLDVYLPGAAGKRPFPVVVFFYGGAGRAGSARITDSWAQRWHREVS